MLQQGKKSTKKKIDKKENRQNNIFFGGVEKDLKSLKIIIR